MTTIVAVLRQRLGIRGGGPLGYVVDEELSPNGLSDIRGILSRNFDGPIESVHIRGTLDALGVSADVREFTLKNGETLVLVDGQLVRRYWGNIATFARLQLGIN